MTKEKEAPFEQMTMNYMLTSYSMPLTAQEMYSSLTTASVGLSTIPSTSVSIVASSSTTHISVPSSSSSSNSGGPRSFSCEICHKTFPRQGNLDRHRRTHDGDRPFSCDLCPKAFSQRSHLKVHRNTHTGEQTFKCHVCGYCFSRNGNLTRHMRTHQRQEVFANENLYNHNGHSESGSKEDSKTLYRAVEKPKPDPHDHQNNSQHQHHHHHHHHHQHQTQQQQQQQQQQSYKCTVCSKSFVPSRHQGGGSTLYCETCWKGLVSNAAKIPPQHSHFHSSHNHHHHHHHHHQSPYQHPTKSKKRLISAAAAAAALHKYQCQLCGRTFPRNGNLERHKSAHLGLKPFGCDICGRMFGQKSHAKVHKMTHTGERPYKCDVCGFAFSRNGNLARHKRYNKFSCLVPGTCQQQTIPQSGRHFAAGNSTLPPLLPPLPQLPPPPLPTSSSPTPTHTEPEAPRPEGLPLDVPEATSQNGSNPVGRVEESGVVVHVAEESEQLVPVPNTQSVTSGNADDVVDTVDSNILNTPQMPNSSVE